MAKKRRKGMTAKQFERGVRKLVRPRKQSSSRASAIAGRWLANLQLRDLENWMIPAKELKTLCASVLSQDETKGRRK